MAARAGPPPPTSAAERMFVLWIVSTLCLVLLASVLTVLGSGRMRRQAEAIQALADRVEALEQVRTAPPQVPAPFAPPRKASPAGDADRRNDVPPTRRSTTTQPSAAAPDRESSAVVRDARTEAGLAALLDEVLRPAAEGPFALAKTEAGAAAVLKDALKHAESANWSGPTLARLAVLARLLDEEAQAESLAARAAAAGTQPLAYLELAARTLLARGRIDEARVAAQRFVQAGGGAPARLLLAEAWLAPPAPNAMAADELLAGISDVRQLAAADRLRLGRLAARMERWELAAAVVAHSEDIPAELSGERDFLLAVLFVREGRLVEALGVLDYLAERRPEDYDVLTWRGVALVAARSYEDARKALAHAERFPQRPEAWYWRAIVELRGGSVDSAARLLEAALTASAQYAPAWEALASLALERRDVATAVQNLALAIQANPRRASSHLLLAIAHAKASRRDDAGQALRQALRLDPDVLETARQAEVITRLFEPEELEQMAIEVASADSQPTTPDAESGW